MGFYRHTFWMQLQSFKYDACNCFSMFPFSHVLRRPWTWCRIRFPLSLRSTLQFVAILEIIPCKEWTGQERQDLYFSNFIACEAWQSIVWAQNQKFLGLIHNLMSLFSAIAVFHWRIFSTFFEFDFPSRESLATSTAVLSAYSSVSIPATRSCSDGISKVLKIKYKKEREKIILKEEKIKRQFSIYLMTMGASPLDDKCL